MGTNKLALLLTVLSICAAAALSPAPAAAQLGAEGQSFDYNPDKDKTTPEVKTGAIETTYDEDAELVDSPMYGTLVLSKNRWKNWVARALYLTVINIALILMVSFLSKSDERNLIIAHVVAGASFAISFWIFLCALLLMKLNEVWQAVSTELYKAAAAKAQSEKGQGAGAQPEGGEPKSEEKKKDDGVIDAEVVDEKK